MSSNNEQVYRYCKMLDAKLNDPSLADKRIVHYCAGPRRALRLLRVVMFTMIATSITIIFSISISVIITTYIITVLLLLLLLLLL